MITIAPISCVRKILSYSSEFCWYDMNPDDVIYFSNKVGKHKKNFMGNNDCDHVQFHGSAFMGMQWGPEYLGRPARFPGELDYAQYSITADYNYPPVYERNVKSQFMIPLTSNQVLSDMDFGYSVGGALVETLTILINHEDIHCFLGFHPNFFSQTERANAYIRLDVGSNCVISYNGGDKWYKPYFVRNTQYSLPAMDWTFSGYHCTLSGYIRLGRYSFSTSFTLQFCDRSETLEGNGKTVMTDQSFISLGNRLRSFILTGLLSLRNSWLLESNFAWRPLFPFSYQPSKLGWKKFFSLKDALLDLALATEPYIDKEMVFGESTQSAADAARKFSGNTGTLIKEIIQLKSSILDLWKLLQGNVTPKSLANLWLSLRYGLKLTYQDATELAESVIDEVALSGRHDLYSWSRGGFSGDDFSTHCKLYYDPDRRNWFAKGIGSLIEWDLFPSLVNVWDIIPYSFVADWFVDIEGFLADFDARTYLSVMEVFSTCYSLKHRWKPKSTVSLGLSGYIYFTRFIRENPTEPYPVIPSFSGNLPSGKNVIDGVSLIIQRL